MRVCHHWLSFGPKISWAFQNPKMSLKKIYKNSCDFRKTKTNFWKDRLPPLAGFRPKNQLGLLKPKTMFKQNWKIIMIFRKNKTNFWIKGLPSLAGFGPKNQLGLPELETVLRKILINSFDFRKKIKINFWKEGYPCDTTPNLWSRDFWISTMATLFSFSLIFTLSYPEIFRPRDFSTPKFFYPEIFWPRDY